MTKVRTRYGNCFYDLNFCSAFRLYNGPLTYAFISEGRNQGSWIDDIWVRSGHKKILKWLMLMYLIIVIILMIILYLRVIFLSKMLVHCLLVMIERIFILTLGRLTLSKYITSKQGCTLQEWLDCYKKQYGCRYLNGMCDDASHGGAINTAYRNFYVMKRDSGIAGWSRKFSEPKYNSRHAARAWYLAGFSMYGIL